MKDKIRNPWFWIGLVSVVFASAGIDFNSLTSWQLFGHALLSIFQNPVALMAVIGGVLGVFNDNGSKGLDTISHDESRSIPGVCWSNEHKKWRAYIGVNGRQKHLGYFDDINDAIKARKDAEDIYK